MIQEIDNSQGWILCPCSLSDAEQNTVNGLKQNKTFNKKKYTLPVLDNYLRYLLENNRYDCAKNFAIKHNMRNHLAFLYCITFDQENLLLLNLQHKCYKHLINWALVMNDFKKLSVLRHDKGLTIQIINEIIYRKQLTDAELLSLIPTLINFKRYNLDVSRPYIIKLTDNFLIETKCGQDSLEFIDSILCKILYMLQDFKACEFYFHQGCDQEIVRFMTLSKKQIPEYTEYIKNNHKKNKCMEFMNHILNKDIEYLKNYKQNDLLDLNVYEVKIVSKLAFECCVGEYDFLAAKIMPVNFYTVKYALIYNNQKFISKNQDAINNDIDLQIVNSYYQKKYNEILKHRKYQSNDYKINSLIKKAMIHL